MRQRAMLGLGVLVLGTMWLGPLPSLASRAFFAHMTMHMAVVAMAAPLIALGVAGHRFDPVRRAPRLFAAIPASFAELIVVWAWHAPVLHQAARERTDMFVLEQSAFFITGLFLWLSVVGGEPAGRSSRAGAGVIALLLTSVHMTLLGALLALTPRSLYPHLHGLPGLTPVADEHLGGVIMLLVGGASYAMGGLWLMTGLLRRAAIAPASRV